MAWLCETCGQEMDSARPDPSTGGWTCPNCGTEAKLDSTEVTPPESEPSELAASKAQDTGGPTEHSAALSESSVETVFQPVLMMESIMDELQTSATESESRSVSEPGTETLETDPTTLPSPFLQLDLEAYFLVLGATPGQERRPLVRAKTTFGRKGADVVLQDPAVSTSHFQIEAFGREFFVRDLDSRNGTFLNGTKVRYSQLLPGDQITVGKTSLIFRTSDDLIDRQ